MSARVCLSGVEMEETGGERWIALPLYIAALGLYF